MKTRHDHNVTDCIDVIYIENDIELSWPIRSGANCDED